MDEFDPTRIPSLAIERPRSVTRLPPQDRMDILALRHTAKWLTVFVRLAYAAWLVLSPFLSLSYVVYWLGGGLCFVIFLALRRLYVDVLRPSSSEPANHRRAHAVFMHQHFGLHCTFVLAWTADRWGALSMMAAGAVTDLWREYRLRHPRDSNVANHVELIPFSSLQARVVQASVILGGALLAVLWATKPTHSASLAMLDHALSLTGHLQFSIGRFSRLLALQGLPDAAMRFRIVMSLCVIMIFYFLLFYTIPLYEYNIDFQRRRTIRPLPFPVINFLLLLAGYTCFYMALISSFGTPNGLNFWTSFGLTGKFEIQDAAVLIIISYFLSSVSVSFISRWRASAVQIPTMGVPGTGT